MKQTRLNSTVEDIRACIAVRMMRIDAAISQTMKPGADPVAIAGDLSEIEALNVLLGSDAVRPFPRDGSQTDEYQAAHRAALDSGLKGVEADTAARDTVKGAR
jgi:hypothetical protein